MNVDRRYIYDEQIKDWGKTSQANVNKKKAKRHDDDIK